VVLIRKTEKPFMKTPIILVVDDDALVLRAIQQDIRAEYKNAYRIIATESAIEALDVIKELKRKNEPVALVVSDQRMPEMEGVELLSKIREVFQDTKTVLLTAYSDIEVAIRAINEIRLDYYLLKPWSPPDEKLYPVLNDLLDDWHRVFIPTYDGIRLIGNQWSPNSHRIKEFLSGNLIPYHWIEYQTSPEGQALLNSSGSSEEELPVLILKDGTVLKNPELGLLAASVGLKQIASQKVYDVVIIGAGPAGLAASVYGSSEGLRTLLIEKNNPGGQASSSARIENYLGFPSGLSGADLTRRAVAQTIRFGTEVLTPQEVKNIVYQGGYKQLTLSDGSTINSRTVIIATGVSYRKLEVPGLEKFTGAGVYYGAAAVEAHACKDQPVFIVGGGNSACQAAMYMYKFASQVNILIRKEELGMVAANYLVNQISGTGNIKVWGNTEVLEVKGNGLLASVTLQNNKTQEVSEHPAKALFIYIGAKPATAWLPDQILKDTKGFIITGSELDNTEGFYRFWDMPRKPYPCETSMPGVFAAGDIRMGALAGISSAVGEGALALRYVRKYLQEM
jgi:thioredoxin reductase (NADPH)